MTIIDLLDQDSLKTFYIENETKIKKIEDYLFDEKEHLFIFLLIEDRGLKIMRLYSNLEQICKFLFFEFSVSLTINEIMLFIQNNILILEDVQVLDGKTQSGIKKYEYANVLIMNRIRVYSFRNMEKSYIYNLSYQEINYRIVEVKKDLYNIIVEFGGFETYKLDSNNKKKFSSYITEVNKKLKLKKDKSMDELNHLLLTNNPSVETIFENLIMEIPKDYFLDPIRFIQFQDTVIKTIGLSNNKLYESVWNEKNQYLYIKAFNEYSIQAHNNIINFNKEYIVHLISMLPKYINISKNITGSYVWLSILEKRIMYYSKEWASLYKTYFLDVPHNYQSYCQVYAHIQEINISDKETISMFIYFLMFNELTDTASFVDEHVKLTEKLPEMVKENELLDFEKRITMKQNKDSIFSFEDIDMLSGLEFEDIIADLFRKMGYHSKTTIASGDQGIDIIAEKDNVRLGIQTKRYSGKVGNTAVQEVVAGLAYYDCKKGLIISNNYFTASAEKLAYKNNVTLWNRDILEIKFKAYYI